MTVATFSATLENCAVMMNLVIFPVFFVSGSLYPVDMLPAYLHVAALANPFTYGVDVVKHATLGADRTSFGGPSSRWSWTPRRRRREASGHRRYLLVVAATW